MNDLRKKKKLLIKGHNLITSTINKKISDLRKKEIISNSIEKLDISLENVDNFNQNMKELGYQEISKSFLIKKINDIEINITRRNNKIKSITAYKNNEIVDLPQEIFDQVKNDINSCL